MTPALLEAHSNPQTTPVGELARSATGPGQTPPAAGLLAHWRAATSNGQTIGWPAGSSAAILDYIARLERTVSELQARIQRNHQVTRRAARNDQTEVRALHQRLAEIDTAVGIQAVYHRLAANQTETPQ